MPTRLMALIARLLIPRCTICGAMVDDRPRWGRRVCDDPTCREQDGYEESLGL